MEVFCEGAVSAQELRLRFRKFLLSSQSIWEHAVKPLNSAEIIKDIVPQRDLQKVK